MQAITHFCYMILESVITLSLAALIGVITAVIVVKIKQNFFDRIPYTRGGEANAHDVE